jgi:integrase
VAVIVKRQGERGTTWRVRIRKGGHELSRSFQSAQAANDWAKETERAIDKATPREPFRPTDWLKRPTDFWEQHADPSLPTPIKNSTLAAIIGRYIRAVDPPKDKANRLNAWTRHPVLGRQPFEAVSAEDLQKHIDARLRKGISANTIRNDVFALSGVFTHANTAPKAGGRGGWGMNVINPCELVTLPPPGDERERRFYVGEESRLRKALSEVPDGLQMLALFSILLETGMRLGEAMSILPSWYVQTENGTHYISIPSKNTKGKKKRNVVLSPAAAQELLNILESREDKFAPFFSLNRPAVEYRWQLARERANVKDLHLHDIRHEALSRMSEKGLTLEELQSQSGHKSVRILMRYLHSNPDRISAKMG